MPLPNDPVSTAGMPHRRATKEKTASGLALSLAVHAAAIGAIGYFAARTGLLPEKLSRFVGITQEPKPKAPEPPKPPPPPTRDEVKEALPETASPPPLAPPVAQPPSVRAADPNARAIGGASSFAAEARVPGETRAPVVKKASPASGRRAQAPAATQRPSAFSEASTKPSTIASVLEERKGAAAVQDTISQEQMSRTGGSDAAEVVAKVTGVTTVEGKFTVVRGLNDRYNVTTLNGAELPSADPRRKAAQLDLVPTAMIDRVVIAKTFTPDLPGGFAGAAVNIVTKSFPSRGFAQAGFGGEYNTQATGNRNYLTYRGGSTDWAGMDDGTRQLPDLLARVSPADLTPPESQRRGETKETAASRARQALKVQDALKSFRSFQFGPDRSAPPPGHSGSFSLGDTTTLFSRPFGYFVSAGYSRKYQFYEDGASVRYRPTDDEPYQDYRDARAITEVNWGTVVNLAQKLTETDEISFNFFYNQNSEDIARQLVGTRENLDSLVDRNILHFIERHLANYQVKGRHEFPLLAGLQADWLVSIADTGQDEPDVRYFNFARDPETGRSEVGNNSLPEPLRPTRIFRAIGEGNFNQRVDFEWPLELWNGRDGRIKFGSALSSSSRQFEQRSFAFDFGAGDNGRWRKGGGPNDYFLGPDLAFVTRPGRFGGTNYVFSREFFTQDFASLAYAGEQETFAGYAMAELPVNRFLKLIGGVRPETTDLTISLAPDQGVHQLDLLPAASAVIAVRSNMNVRLAYSSTLARPTFREISPIRELDPIELEYVEGNPSLRLSTIENYDLRWEWFVRPGEVISVSGFYKSITDAIEKTVLNFAGDLVTYANRPQARLYGAEFEFRRQLDAIPGLGGLSAGFNFSYVLSEVPLTATELAADPGARSPRSLFDQSEWVVNADLTYECRPTGTSLTVAAAQAGPRIYAVDPGGPDIYEHPPLSLDVLVTQRLGRNWKLKLSARNLLNPEIRRTYGEKYGGRLYSSYTRGIIVGLSASYDF